MRYGQETIDEAIEVLEGVIELAEKEQLLQGRYVSSICGGRKACLIGSLFLVAHAEPQVFRGVSTLVEAHEGFRDTFMADRPGLKLAYEALNTEAELYAYEHNLDLTPGYDEEDFHSAAEALFEVGLKGMDYDEIRDHVITVCRNAQRALQPIEAQQEAVYALA